MHKLIKACTNYCFAQRYMAVADCMKFWEESFYGPDNLLVAGME